MFESGEVKNLQFEIERLNIGVLRMCKVREPGNGTRYSNETEIVSTELQLF